MTSLFSFEIMMMLLMLPLVVGFGHRPANVLGRDDLAVDVRRANVSGASDVHCSSPIVLVGRHDLAVDVRRADVLGARDVVAALAALVREVVQECVSAEAPPDEGLDAGGDGGGPGERGAHRGGCARGQLGAGSHQGQDAAAPPSLLLLRYDGDGVCFIFYVSVEKHVVVVVVVFAVVFLR